MPTLYLMFGYPGAGKTTAAEIISQITGAIHLSSDKVRLELFPNPTFSQLEHDALYQTLDKRTEELLRSGKSVIYDANLNRYQHRKDKYNICRRSGATPKLVWVQASRDVAKKRALHESRQHLWPRHETPHQLFDRVADVLEEPGPSEPFVVLDGTKITDNYIRSTLQIL